VSDEKLDLSMAQLATSVLSTVTVSLVSAKFLGSAGTLTAAACTSALSTSASAIYKHGWHRTATKVKTVKTKKFRNVDPAKTVLDNVGGYTVTTQKTSRVPNWKLIGSTAGVAGAIFAGWLALTTGAEAVAGKPVSAIVQHKQGSGTSLFGGHVSPEPTPTVQPTTSFTSKATPTPEGTQRTTRPPAAPVTPVPQPSVAPTTAPPATPEEPEPQPTG
jgi:hypothetical protein